MKTMITCISLLFCVGSVSSQTNHCTTTKTFYETGYTYQCDISASQMVTLYNKSNKLTYMDVVYKATGKLFFPTTREEYNIVEDDTWTKQSCYSIVNKAFSESEKARIKGKELSTVLYISSETGKVTEVSFNFTTFEPYVTIPVSVYRKIETELKSKIWFTITAEGRKLNYIMLSWDHEPQ